MHEKEGAIIRVSHKTKISGRKINISEIYHKVTPAGHCLKFYGSKSATLACALIV
jgi:hypothetical protein